MRQILLRASGSIGFRKRLVRSRLVRHAASRFMPGEHIDQALAAARPLWEEGIPSEFTILGEDVREPGEADATTDRYLEALDAIQASSLPIDLSVKLSQLGLGLDAATTDVRLQRLVAAAAERGRLVWIDMEDSSTAAATIEAFRQARTRYENVGLCLQAYLLRTPEDLAGLLPLAPRIRLVKGAYKEPAELALQKRADVSEAFVRLAGDLLEAASRGGPPPVFATHDTDLLERIFTRAEELGVAPGAYEVHMLYGIRTQQLRTLAASGHRVAVLISYGSEWAAWYLRRLAERPANLVFAAWALARR